MDESKRLGERLMMGLRLREGVVLDADVLDAPRRAVIDRAMALGQMTWADNRLALTRDGQIIADSILSELI